MSSDRHRLTLPKVLSDPVSSRFIARTASAASPRTSRVLGHDNGSCSVEENTTLGVSFNTSTPSAPSAANPDISRYVFAPIRSVRFRSGGSPSQARYSGPSNPHQPGHPSAEA